MGARGTGSGWAALAAGAGSCAALPLAVYLTRFSDRYDLLHASAAIPLAGGLGALALVLAARARREQAVRLARTRPSAPARAGRALGGLGVGLALAGVVALVVFALLQYAGTRR